jgi:hypothetical protein
MPTRIISKLFKVGGVLTNVTTARLSDPDGIYGVKRNDLSAKTITGATQADPVVLTAVGHGLSDGQMIHVAGVVGMAELNGNDYYVDVLTADTLALYADSGLTTAVDGTGYTAYTSGGTETPIEVADDTAMTSSSTGAYQYSFTDTVGIAYTAYVEFVYAGATYHFEVDLPARSAATAGMVLSYSGLQELIGRKFFGKRSGWSGAETSDIDDIIRTGLQSVYRAHRWSFLRPTEPIVTVADTGTYDLPSDFDGFDENLLTWPAGEGYYRPIPIVPYNDIRRALSQNNTTGRPTHAAIIAVEYDGTVGSKRQIVFYPTPDDAYTFTGQMRLRWKMIDGTDEYPIGGEIVADAIIEGCMAAGERMLDDAPGVHAEAFTAALEAAIRQDKEATSPPTLGQDGGPLDVDGRLLSRAALMGDVTFNSVTQ